MNRYLKTAILISVFMAVFVCKVGACSNAPPIAGITDYSKTVDVGKTIPFISNSTDSDGTIVDYDWDIPSEAYYVSGQGTNTLKCKFSPASGGTPYVVKLRVKDNTGYWSHVDGEGDVCEVTVTSPGTGTEGTNWWYVKTDGNDDNDGQSVGTAFATIQMGIDTAINDDTVHVAEGTYYENIDFGGKDITVTSSDPDDPASTVIDGDALNPVVNLDGVSSTSAGISGFTITSTSSSQSDSREAASYYNFETDCNDQTGHNDGSPINGASIIASSGDYFSGDGVLQLDGTQSQYVDLGSTNYVYNNFAVSMWFQTSGSDQWLLECPPKTVPFTVRV